MAKMPDEKTLDKMESLLNIASDYTRLKILYAISNGDLCVNDIVKLVGASQSLVSHQLKVLRKAKLVATHKEGTKVYYKLDDEHVLALLDIVYSHVSE
ncbi:MAG: metalloregulator ArsR/SmtB family transcription factor [Bacilli bacterium]|jgi:ArsR family transcriptional regulator|nr:metalloregulator ArsR/SmtB family transcription factor [Bacilli bacterium]MCH4228099.1 metalloregulator ArsR/SmtB family transcription factor [Bacilli bacterium]MCH4278174.1 metalloregulator ArsR/SmtB family transcription factor [Bacilli bacterium]MCI2110980.1 metalloregulator ArsR/SmtB family transcription factor [Bacilli bacterium]